MTWPAHGGQPEKILTLTGTPKSTEQQYYDFSANINPLGPPKGIREAIPSLFHHVHTYPDPDYKEATSKLAIHDGLNEEHVLLTNGGAEAIFLVAQQFTGKKALIIEPTFSEYERACEAYGVSISHLYLNEDTSFSLPLDQVLNQMEDVDVIFLCRPNNPTGTVVDIEDIRAILNKGQETQTTIVVDEAFIHFVPSEITDLTHLVDQYPNLVLLRSLTKIYSVPGLRLGYVIARPTWIAKLKKHQIPWSVNGIVTSLLPQLFSEKRFIEDTKSWLEQELKTLKTELTHLNFYISPTLVNFYLLKDDAIEELFLYLVKNKIIPRHTHTFKRLNGQYIRLAVRSEEENRYLLQILRQWRKKG